MNSEHNKIILLLCVSTSFSTMSFLSQLLIPSLLLLSLNTSTSSNSTTTMDHSERETLLSIMESMSSDRDWRSYSLDPCIPGSSWPGIECKAGHITKLIFGTPPNPTCRSSATFTSQIFNLPFLKSIHFLNCFKTKKTTLFFPLHSDNFPLQQLSLIGNPALVGLIPPQVSSLKSLQVLTLSMNHLYGKIPQSLSLLTHLIHLDLSYNSLTGRIPTQMGKLSSLVDLDLSYNSLTGPIPVSIGDMGLLQKLDLSSNQLTGTIPKSVVNFKLLTFLDLSDNRLTGYPHPSNSIANLQSLQYLIMDSNPMFVPLPPELGRLTRLQELRLANSGYWGTIPESFSVLRNLTTLSLENNRLSGEIPPGLGGLGRIYHLNLSRNMLGGVAPFGFEFLRRLGKNLDLSGNPGLCINGSGGFQGVLGVGVGICRSESSSSDVLSLESSSVTASALEDWVIGLCFVGFSAVQQSLWFL